MSVEVMAVFPGVFALPDSVILVMLVVLVTALKRKWLFLPRLVMCSLLQVKKKRF